MSFLKVSNKTEKKLVSSLVIDGSVYCASVRKANRSIHESLAVKQLIFNPKYVASAALINERLFPGVRAHN